MSNWIKAINPTGAITTEAEAVTAARASALAIFLGVVVGIVAVAMMMNGGMAAIEAAATAAAGDNPQAASMTGAIVQGAFYMAIAMVVIQLILGLVQWFKPNVVIPILFLVLVVYGLGTSALGLTVDQSNVPQTAANAPVMHSTWSFCSSS
ncbi:hypothetical protein [Brevundimonas sp.]|uniref:hypothetical protein n=1 Tax=Brevundimonas sp. TaxID=1871086 RepID=UPI003567637D